MPSGPGCPRSFHGPAGNQGEATFLNSRPVIPGNKRAQEGAMEREWGWFGNSSAGPLLISLFPLTDLGLHLTRQSASPERPQTGTLPAFLYEKLIWTPFKFFSWKGLNKLKFNYPSTHRALFCMLQFLTCSLFEVGELLPARCSSPCSHISSCTDRSSQPNTWLVGAPARTKSHI